MIFYLDTSALVKRYVREPGSRAVRELVRRQPVAVCRIAYAELAAAIARLHQEKLLSQTLRDRILARIDRDFSDYTVVEIRASLVQRVPELVVRHVLRGYDAVQLAAALTLHERGPAIEFWSDDERLVKAARAEGLRATFASANR